MYFRREQGRMWVRTRLLKGDHFKSFGNLSHMNVLPIDKKNEILKSKTSTMKVKISNIENTGLRADPEELKRQ